ncbi:MAG: MarR family transcriptional regulator [Nitriliruptor sp.]
MTTSPPPPPARDDEPIVPAPQMAAWRAFLTAHARLTDELARELRDRVGLPLTWYDVLVQLSEADEHRLRMQDLAGRVLLSKSGLTRLIDRMERDGLVARSPCQDDRRGTWAQMTDRGYDVIRSSAPTHLAGVREHFADLLGDHEAAVVAEALGRVVERLEA